MKRQNVKMAHCWLVAALVAGAAWGQSWPGGWPPSSKPPRTNNEGPWLDYLPEDNQPSVSQTNAGSNGAWSSNPPSRETVSKNNANANELNRQCKTAYDAHRYTEAADLCEQALRMGDVRVREGLAMIYRFGLRQCSKAAVYYEMEKDNHRGAANGLGEMYWLGCADFPTDYVKARALFVSAASRGFSSAWENLGWMDELGHGAAHNRQKAIEELVKAAALDNNDWTNDTIRALRNPNAPTRFNSPQQLGSYVADMRFARDMAAYNADMANHPKPSNEGWLQCAPGNPAIPGNQGWCMIHH